MENRVQKDELQDTEVVQKCCKKGLWGSVRLNGAFGVWRGDKCQKKEGET